MQFNGGVVGGLVFGGLVAWGALDVLSGRWVAAGAPLFSALALVGLLLMAGEPAQRAAGKLIGAIGIAAGAVHALIVNLDASASPSAALDAWGFLLIPAGIVLAMSGYLQPKQAWWVVRGVALVAIVAVVRLCVVAYLTRDSILVGTGVAWAGFLIAGGWAAWRLLKARLTTPMPTRP